MGVLRIAAEKVRFPRSTQITDDTSILTLMNLVLEPLCRWENGIVRPGLLAEWQHYDGGRRWVFDLRERAVFHDGLPCKAEHVATCIGDILRSVDRFGMKWAYARYLADAKVTVQSRRRIQIENPAPFADILDIFSDFYVRRETDDGYAVLGTGPYRVVKYEEDGCTELVRADKEGPGPSHISFVAHPRAESRYEALRAGAVDAALNLERSERRLDFDGHWDWVKARTTMSVMCYLNCFRGAFASVEARLAVNHAVNAQAIVDEVLHGLGAPTATVVSPHHLGASWAGLEPIPYDPVAAARLFERAGISGPLVIRTPEFMPDKAVEISTAVAEALRTIGVETRLEVQPDRPEYAREVGRKEIGDIAIFDSTPHSTYRVLNDKISSASRGLWWQGHDDAALEAMINEANFAVLPAEREVAYGKCLSRLRANPPWLYLFNPVEVFAARKGVTGLRLDSRGLLQVPS